jgi:hypothetical protein
MLHILRNAVIPTHAIIRFHHTNSPRSRLLRSPLLLLLIRQIRVLILVSLVVPLHIFVLNFILVPDGWGVSVDGESGGEGYASGLSRARADKAFRFLTGDGRRAVALALSRGKVVAEAVSGGVKVLLKLCLGSGSKL